jgi:hypothetical protein
MFNLNIRVLGNGHILVQYNRDGKAFDAGFNDWNTFIAWLRENTRGVPL